MIRLAHFYVAMPGKSADLIAVLKEAAEVIKADLGVDIAIFGSIGGPVGEFVSALNYASLANFEEKATKILASPRYQAITKKMEGLLVPGAAREHLLRQV